MNKKFSFEYLPESVYELHIKLNKIEDLLLKSLIKTELTNNDQLLTVPEVAELLSLKPSSIYRYVQEGQIPVCKRNRAKRLYFSKGEIIDWIKAGRKKTKLELSEEVEFKLKEKGGTYE